MGTVTVYQLNRNTTWDGTLVKYLSNFTNYANSIVLLMLIREAHQSGLRYVANPNAAFDKYFDWLRLFISSAVDLGKNSLWRHLVPILVGDFYFKPGIIKAYEEIAMNFEETLKSLMECYSFVGLPSTTEDYFFVSGDDLHTGSIKLQTCRGTKEIFVEILPSGSSGIWFGYVEHSTLWSLFPIMKSRTEDWQKWLEATLTIPSVVEAHYRIKPTYCEFGALHRNSIPMTSSVSCEIKLPKCTVRTVLKQIVQSVKQLAPDNDVKVYYLDFGKRQHVRWFAYFITNIPTRAVVTLYIESDEASWKTVITGNIYYSSFNDYSIRPDKVFLQFFTSVFTGLT